MDQTEPNYWDVIRYEVDMLVNLMNLSAIQCKLAYLTSPAEIECQIEELPYPLNNAIAESKILHIRNIADILREPPKEPGDDILIEPFLENLPKKDEIEGLIQEFRIEYGKSRDENTPCWEINKHLAHPTKKRSTTHNYETLINRLYPRIVNIFALIAPDQYGKFQTITEADPKKSSAPQSQNAASSTTSSTIISSVINQKADNTPLI